MKRIKRIASLILAMAMIFAMSATVFAAQDGSDPSNVINSEGDSKDNTTVDPAQKPTIASGSYNIYQVFTGDYANGVLSNVKWGQNSQNNGQTVKVGDPVPESVLDELEKVYTKDDTADDNYGLNDNEQLAVIKKYANLTNPIIANQDKTEYTGLTPGYYLVEGKVDFTNGSSANTLYVVRVIDGKLSFQPKVDVPTSDKKIVEGSDKLSNNEASIGDEVNYEITGTMPSNIADYKTYYYKFTDTLSKGLTYKEDSIKVTVNGVDVTKYFYKGVGTYSETAGTEIEVSILDVKALSLLTDPTVGDITKYTTVVLTYTATLNENAVIAGDGNPNDVKLTYSNDPNNSGDGPTTPPENPDKPTPTHPTGETPEIEVVTYTTELTILKTDEDNKFLPGVEFTLTGKGVNVVLVTEETFTEAADGEYWKLKDGTYTTTAPTVADDETDNTADYDSTETKYTKTTSVVAKGNGKTETNVVGVVQADGTVTFKGLGAGGYTITETKTLPGYNTIDPISFTLTFDAAKTPMFASNNDKVTVGTDNTLDTSIVNQSGSLLPSTGGIGTTIFYVVGGALVAGAGILLVTKKRMSAR